MLQVQGLTKYFGGLAALKDVSFEVPEKYIYGFIGPNGAGKTTLFSAIAGSVQPSSGRIHSRGKDVTGMRPDALVRSGIARTHQVVRPFRTMSVLENVQVAVHFGRSKVTRASLAREQARQVLNWVGLEHAAERPASSLALGDQKRLEVARALATEPALLLCDEICGGLTVPETRNMLDLLRRIRERGTTIMYVEHDMKAVMGVCDHIVVLNFGQKLAEGKPEEIQNNQAVIEAYLGKPNPGSKAIA